MIVLLKKYVVGSLPKLIRGEWASMSLFDKWEAGTKICGALGIVTIAMSPELEILTEIKNRLGPEVKKFDTVYVSKAARDGEAIAINLKKVRTEEPLQYQLWMCAGQNNRQMVFFGEGFLGREEADNTLRVSIADTPSQVLLKVTGNEIEYARYENWDLYRSVKESDTTVVQGDVNCGEV
jgi:hypothetical protein